MKHQPNANLNLNLPRFNMVIGKINMVIRRAMFVDFLVEYLDILPVVFIIDYEVVNEFIRV